MDSLAANRLWPVGEARNDSDSIASSYTLHDIVYQYGHGSIYS